MPQPLTSWSFRDLETAIANLVDAEREIKKLTDAPSIANEHREIASDVRAYIKTARQFLKEVRAHQEDLLTPNGQEETPAYTQTAD